MLLDCSSKGVNKDDAFDSAATIAAFMQGISKSLPSGYSLQTVANLRFNGSAYYLGT